MTYRPWPQGWVWANLAQLSWDCGYGTSQKCDYGAPGMPVLRIPNIAAGRIDITDLKYALDPVAVNQSDQLDVADLLIVRTNGSKDLIGRGAVVQYKFDGPHYFASYLIRYRLLADMGKLVESLGVAPREEAKVVMANGAPAASAAPAPAETTAPAAEPVATEAAPVEAAPAAEPMPATEAPAP